MIDLHILNYCKFNCRHETQLRLTERDDLKTIPKFSGYLTADRTPRYDIGGTQMTLCHPGSKKVS
jgi:hypothetical protein